MKKQAAITVACFFISILGKRVAYVKRRRVSNLGGLDNDDCWNAGICNQTSNV